jgi:methyl-accepting chemotaxis protein
MVDRAMPEGGPVSRLIGNFGVATKFRIMVGVTLIGLAAMAGLNLMTLHSSLLDSRSLQTRSVVEAAISVVDHYQGLVVKGELKQDEAMEAAAITIGGMRFAQGEYLWINDNQGLMVMHPIKPALNGKNTSGLKDPTGKLFFQAMLDVVAKDGEGFVDYMWPKPGHEEPVPKISYVKGYPAWKWIVGSGVYVDDVEAAFYDAAKGTAVMAVIVLLLVVGVSVIFAANLTRPLRSLVDSIRRISEGDADLTIGFQSRADEVGIIARRLELLRDEVNKAFNLRQMVDVQPARVMMCDPKTLAITYINQAAKDVIKRMNHPISKQVDNLIGVCLSDFHKTPEMLERLLRDPKNLPYSGKFSMGGLTIENHVNAIYDRKGTYIGPMLNWEDVTKYVQMADEFEKKVRSVSQHVGEGARRMAELAASMRTSADETTNRSEAVSSAAERAAMGVDAVTSAADQLSASISEISRQVSDATRIAQGAVTEAQETNETMRGLADATSRIGEVVSLITDIANQTNLLALNATIEAARAGDAGKGFAVVANEVKNLANQTARATEDIGKQIQEVQTVSDRAVSAIGSISATISRIDEIAAGIADAVREQGGATEEIIRSVDQASAGTQEVTSNISAVSGVARKTEDGAAGVFDAARDLSQQSDILEREVDAFLKRMQH